MATSLFFLDLNILFLECQDKSAHILVSNEGDFCVYLKWNNMKRKDGPHEGVDIAISHGSPYAQPVPT